MGIVTRGAAAAAQEGGLKLRKSGSYPLVAGAVALVPPRKDKDSFQIMASPGCSVPASCSAHAVLPADLLAWASWAAAAALT